MKISAQITLWAGIVFALVCFGVAIKGFSSLGEITDAKVLADAKGFAFFWTFLGVIGAVFAGVSWWIIKTDKGDRG